MARPAAGSRYEWLVGRWLDVVTWSPAKKTALALGIALVFHVVVLSLALLAAVTWSPGLVDPVQLVRLAVIVVVCNVILLAVSFATARRGRDGRWTVYLLIFTYVPLQARFVSLFGTASTPWLGIPLLLILFIPVFFDPRAGRVAFAYFIAILLTMSVLELAGRIPFAPAMQLRSLDAQLTPGWYAAVYIVVFAVFAYVYVLVEFLVVAREVQQRRLEAAYHELTQAKALLERGTKLIRRYVPTQLAEQLLSATAESDGGHHRRTLTIFFSDIEGFTKIVDQIEPENASRMLNEYLSEMAAIAERFGGTIDKFVGDAVMILFGAPGPPHVPEHAVSAVKMALAMQARAAELASKWFNEGVETPFRVRMGINTGPASVGSFGSTGRMDYTAIGNQVNLAARIQTHCTPGSVLISHSTWGLVKDQVDCTEIGDVRVKGLHYPVKVYEVRPKGFAG